ncbi:MAG: epoxyqueuosine reductase QueH [bacterium]|nr:epoxyqueuosine reductase QueH [bacterium]
MESKIYLHICCAPCLIYFCEYFKKENIQWKGYFFNPNIHPEAEYNKRTDCLKKFIMENNFSVDFENRGTEKEFLNRIGENKEHWKKAKNSRCHICYEWRLKETALSAKREGYRYFSTTLLISPYQDHDKIRELGEAIAKECGLEFYYKDFRPFFREGRKMAKDKVFYFQKYCGCLLSLI